MSQEFRDLYLKSLENPIDFWAKEAEKVYWYRKWKVTYDGKNPPFYRWFVGGKINITYNAVDRHVLNGRANKAALIWVSSDGNDRVLRYRDLYREVNRLAYVLRGMGIGRGDRVVIYMPMIPETMVAMLAVERLGAVHSVVFSGFGAAALADRIKDSGAKLVITTDGMHRRGRTIPLKPVVDEALRELGGVKTLVFRYVGIDVNMVEGRDFWWHELIKDVPQSAYVEPEPVDSEEPLFILYTSGTTGKPKGITHLHGAYTVWIKYAFSHLVGAESRDSDDVVFFSTADVGWISGHHYGVHGPLLNGLTVLWYEDAPDHPHPGIWWELVDKYGVTHILFAPTSIRLLMKYGDEVPRRYSLNTLRVVISTGEVLNMEAYKWLMSNVCRDSDCQVIDIWGQTETACFVTAPGSANLGGFKYKYGSVGLPYPTLRLKVLDDSGKPLPPGQKGHVVVEPPLPPAFLYTVWNDPGRYVTSYWNKFPGYYYTGDYGMVDEDGYLYIMGRTDDVIKIAGHRISTREIEDIVASMPNVAEAAVIGIPDEVRGEVLGIFVVPKAGAKVSEEEVIEHVRKSLGPLAVIGKVVIVDKLPKTRTGKVMRRVLRAIATGAPIGDISTLEDEESIKEVETKIR